MGRAIGNYFTGIREILLNQELSVPRWSLCCRSCCCDQGSTGWADGAAAACPGCDPHGLCWLKEEIFPHTNITLRPCFLGPLRSAWASEDSLGSSHCSEWGCAWWAVLIFAVMWRHFRKCWNVIEGVGYRDKSWFPLLPNAGEKSGCFINLPQFPHNWT